jgi:hypothetical protein
MNLPKQATLIYLAVAALFAVGIWLVLETGSRFLVAPPDLSGNWHLTQEENLLEPALSIHQSGKFIRMSYNGIQLDLILNSTTQTGNEQKLSLAGGGWNVEAVGNPANNLLNFTFSPPRDQQSIPSGIYTIAQATSPIKPTTAPSNHAGI